MKYCFKLSIFFLFLHVFYMQSMEDEYFPADEYLLALNANEYNPILSAIVSGNLDEVKYYIEQKNVGLNRKIDYFGSSSCYYYNPNCLLDLAVYYNKLDIVKYLIGMGSKLSNRYEDTLSPLHYANTVEMAKYLLEKGLDPNVRDSRGYPPLYYVNSLVFKYLVTHGGADPNLKIGDISLLRQVISDCGNANVCSSSHKDRIRLLVQNNANLFERFPNAPLVENFEDPFKTSPNNLSAFQLLRRKNFVDAEFPAIGCKSYAVEHKGELVISRQFTKELLQRADYFILHKGQKISSRSYMQKVMEELREKTKERKS